MPPPKRRPRTSRQAACLAVAAGFATLAIAAPADAYHALYRIEAPRTAKAGSTIDVTLTFKPLRLNFKLVRLLLEYHPNPTGGRNIREVLFLKNTRKGKTVTKRLKIPAVCVPSPEPELDGPCEPTAMLGDSFLWTPGPDKGVGLSNYPRRIVRIIP